MTEITPEQCKSHKDQCYKTNIFPIMEELKEIKTDIKELTKTVLVLPASLRNEFDDIYAGKSIENDVKDLKDKKDKGLLYLLDKILQIFIAVLLAYITIKMSVLK